MGIGRYGLWVRDFCRALAIHGPPKGQTIAEAFRIGIKSLPILLIIAAFVGTNLALQGYNAFKPLGGQRLVGMFVSLAGVRELAPIIAAAMISAKAGTEMASQIGVMKIREQVDALEVMAVNPLAYLVAPRLVGIMLVLPALTIIAIFVMLRLRLLGGGPPAGLGRARIHPVCVRVYRAHRLSLRGIQGDVLRPDHLHHQLLLRLQLRQRTRRCRSSNQPGGGDLERRVHRAELLSE